MTKYIKILAYAGLALCHVQWLSATVKTLKMLEFAGVILNTFEVLQIYQLLSW